MNKTLN